MPSLLAQMAAARINSMQPQVAKRRPAVVRYSPGQVVPTARVRQPPPPGPARPQHPSQQAPVRQQAQQAAGVAFRDLEEAYANTPTARRQAEDQAKKEAEARNPDLPWWMKIGGLVNQAMVPLGLLGTGRRAIETGLGEAAIHVPDPIQRIAFGLGAAQSGSLGAAMMGQNPITQIANPAAYSTKTSQGGFIDPQRAREAIGNPAASILNPQSDLGFGQFLDPANGKWTNRVIGLTGDIATDPVTYVNPIPTARLATGGSEELAKVADEAETALRQAVKAGAPEAEVAAKGAARDAAAETFRASQSSAPVHGRADRIRIISEAMARDPEAAAQFQSEWLKGGQRGFNTMTPEARRALGIAEPGIFMPGGTRIPGTGGYAERASQLGGALRAARDPLSTRVPLLSRLTSGPKGLEAAYSVLSRGGDQATPENAAALMRGSYAIRAGQGRVETGGNRYLTRLVRNTFRKNSSEANRQLLREAELNAEPNEINQTIQDVANLYESVSGDTIPRGETPNQYVPHVLTPAAKRMMRDKMQDPVVADLAKQLGFVKDDLLEGSGFVEKARVFKPNADGTPATFHIGGKELVVDRGDLGELNQKLGQLFPGFKGKFYQDDPVHIIESYIDSLAKGAGAKKALNVLAAEGGEQAGQVQRITGPLAQGLNERNAALAAQFPEADLARGGYDPAAFTQTLEGPTPTGSPLTQVVNPVADRPEIPTEVAGINLEDYFRNTKAQAATTARDEALKGPAKAYVAAARKDVKPVYATIREDLADLKNQITAPLKEGQKEATKLLPGLEEQVRTAQNELDSIFGTGLRYSTRNLDEGERGRVVKQLSDYTVGINRDIDALEEALANKDRYFKGVLSREQKQLVKRLEGSLRTLRDIRDQAKARMGDLPERLRAEAAAREEQLLRPLRDLEGTIRIEQGEAARRVPPPSKERLDWALQTMAGNDDEKRAVLRSQYEAARRLMADNPEGRALIGPIEGGGLPRTKNGRLTAESMRQIEEARATIASHETGAIASGEAVRPRAQGQLVTPAYNADEQALYDARQRLEDTPLRNTRQRRTIQGEIDRLQRKFNPGGEHYAETHARAVLAEQADHEASQAAIEAKYGRDKARLEGIMRNQVERGANYATQAPRTEAQAIQDLRNAALVTKTQSPEAMTIRRTEPRIAAEEARLANIRAGGIDPERDVGLPMSVTERKMNTPVIDPASGDVMPASEAVGLNRRRRILRDVVTDATNERISQLEQRGIGVQAKLLADSKDVTRLSLQRDYAAQLLPQLEVLKPKSVPKAELGDTLEAIAGVARANPNFSDADLTATESLLQSHREGLLLAAQKEVTAKQVALMTKNAYEGKLAPVMLSALNDNWHMMHSGVLKEGDTIVNAQLHAMFQNLTVLDKEPSKFGRLFNSLTNLFKTYATLTPGFHVRNALSGIFMNTADGVALDAQLEGAKLWNKYMKGGEEWLATQDQRVKDAFEAVAATGAGGRFTESGVASVSGDIQQQTLKSIYDKLAANRLTRFSQRWGERVEGGLRMGMALDSLDRGESTTGAIARITRVHFDYGQISSFDKTMKQFIPFWTFMSRNLPLQVSQMWTEPRAYQIYGSIVRNFKADNVPYTPQYWLDAGSFNTGLQVPDNSLPILGKASGLPIYLQPDLGVSRVTGDIANLERIGSNPAGVLSDFNPLITAPIEYATHHNLYTDQSYGPNDYEKVSGPFGLVANAIGAVTGNRNAQGEVSENLLNVLRSVNPLSDRQSRLLPQLSGGDPEAERRQAESIARFMGVPVRTLTPHQQDTEYLRQYYDQKDQAAAERAALRRQLERQLQAQAS